MANITRATRSARLRWAAIRAQAARTGQRVGQGGKLLPRMTTSATPNLTTLQGHASIMIPVSPTLNIGITGSNVGEVLLTYNKLRDHLGVQA